jgi:hypothetical protein
MPSISYEWKVDFALILSILSILSTIVLWLIEHRNNRKLVRVQAYEEIYNDACFLLEFPLHKRDRDAKRIQYVNKDPELQKAVRSFLALHWMDQYWSHQKYVPSTITDEEQRRSFIKLVFSEANNFRNNLISYASDFSVPELSPAFHIDEPEVSEHLEYIIRYVGKHLSSFSRPIRRHWESARFVSPIEVKNKYERATKVCPGYFEHNARDFEDPFYDLLVSIRREYRDITKNRKEAIVEASHMRYLRMKYVFARLIFRGKKKL